MIGRLITAARAGVDAALALPRRVGELERDLEDLRARVAELDLEGGARLDEHLGKWNGGVG